MIGKKGRKEQGEGNLRGSKEKNTRERSHRGGIKEQKTVYGIVSYVERNRKQDGMEYMIKKKTT